MHFRKSARWSAASQVRQGATLRLPAGASAVRRACRCGQRDASGELSKIVVHPGCTGNGLLPEGFTAGTSGRRKNKKPGCPFGIIRASQPDLSVVAVGLSSCDLGTVPPDDESVLQVGAMHACIERTAMVGAADDVGDQHGERCNTHGNARCQCGRRASRRVHQLLHLGFHIDLHKNGLKNGPLALSD